MDVKPGRLEKRRERDWRLSKCGTTDYKWMDRIINEEVLGRIGERRTLWKSLKKRWGTH